MANESNIHVTIVTDAVTDGIDAVNKAFTVLDAFKFASVQEALSSVINLTKDAALAGAKMVDDLVQAAAKVQTDEFPIVQMLKATGQNAEEVTSMITRLSEQMGTLTNARESLTTMTQSLMLMGVPVQNLEARLIELASIQNSLGVSSEAVIAAYQRFRIAIETGNLQMRGFGESSKVMAAMLIELEKYFGVTETRIKEMFKNNEITINDFIAALRKGASEGGAFADSFAAKKLIFSGAVSDMRNAWRLLEEELGKPIVNFLTPEIEKVAELERALAYIAQHEGWKVAIQVAWQLVITELARIAAEIIVAVFTNIGPAAAEAFWAGWVAKLKTMMSAFSAAGGIIPQIDFSKLFTFATGPVDIKTTVTTLLNKSLGDLKIDTPTALEKIKEAIAAIHAQGPVLPPETPEQLDRVAKGSQAASDALKELKAQMEAIKLEQQLIKGEPFGGADEKSAEMIHLNALAMQNLQNEIAKIQQMKAAGLIDPKQMEQADADIQKATIDLAKLRLEQLGLTHGVQADLQKWVDGWGTASHQIAQTIQQTIGQALQGLNQWIVTGKFNLQQMMQSIEMLGLQLIEQLILQRIVGMLNSNLAAQQAAITGPLIASAYAPAATAVTIATEGQAAAMAPGEYALAAAAIQAMAVAHSGMEVGGLAADERLIVAQTGEIIVRRDVAQQNRDLLLAMNAGDRRAGGQSFYINSGVGIRNIGGRGRLHEGGMIGGGSGAGIHIYAFTDLSAMSKHMATRQGKKVLFDTIRGNRIDLGLQ